MAAAEAVFNLISTHNRPFGVQGMVDNLQSAGIKKAAVQKACDALTEAGRIVCKEFGKTKIYFPKQDGLEVLSREDMAAKQAELKQLQEQLVAANKAVREEEAALRSWQSSLTVEQLQARVRQLTERSEAQLAKLGTLRSGAKLVSPEERRKAEAALRVALDAWRKRRSVFRNIWDTMAESIEGKQADLFEEIGVDTDEAAGVRMADVEAQLARAKPAATGVKRPRG